MAIRRGWQVLIRRRHCCRQAVGGRIQRTAVEIQVRWSDEEVAICDADADDVGDAGEC